MCVCACVYTVLLFRYLELQEKDSTTYEKDPTMINFNKLRGLSSLLKEVHLSQTISYDFVELEHIQTWIRRYLFSLSEVSLDNLSNKVCQSFSLERVI
jgi:hypothetical protein